MNQPKISSLLDVTAIAEYLKRIGAEPRSLKTAVIKEIKGRYWQDTAIIRFDPVAGTVDAPLGNDPTEQEREAIRRDCAMFTWPKVWKVKEPKTWHPDITTAEKKNVFEFRDREGKLLMVQVRKTKRDGEKAYVPYCYYDDGEWRKAEPD